VVAGLDGVDPEPAAGVHRFASFGSNTRRIARPTCGSRSRVRLEAQRHRAAAGRAAVDGHAPFDRARGGGERQVESTLLARRQLYGRKLNNWGYEDIVPEEIIREGAKADAIKQLIDEDPDIGILVLGASVDTAGPGPLVSTLASGKNAGSFPVPITVVPGGLTIEEVEALS
jgi:hypothetical protein